MIKQLSVIALLFAVVILNGCIIVAAPAAGMFYTDVKYGDSATTATASTKTGKACATSILGWVAWGDASVTAAKANGGITAVAVVDHSAQSILGVWGEWCTVVSGS
jgi:hypothetical protein